MATPTKSTQVQLFHHAKASGATLDDFAVVEVDVPPLQEGDVLVRTDFVFVAAAYQDMMRPDCQLPVPPFQIGAPIGGGEVGTVIESRSALLEPGDAVYMWQGWREYAVAPAESFVKLDRTLFPSTSYFLSQGPTAFYGMARVAKAGEGDTVYVSGAAGGVGSLAVQIAKRLGAERVIGSAGSAEKVAYLTDELGVDAAFNYKEGTVADQLAELAPEGISVFFDNVGGQQFEAAVEAARPFARLALCGALSGQIGGNGGAPRLDLMTAITKHLSILPFATYHTEEQIADWTTHFAEWLGAGQFVFPQTVVRGGIGEAPQTLLRLLAGEHRGNVVVQVSENPDE
ncbi:NADP-dependent oxidoreductase [Enemella evansiae]|uniref:MDR family NADP-dependent oxidoreductase n=1 Tax=Enemella evansiae TaxID=2016499 RepID=UPI000B96D919|nr:NADP-dependent oxidoreductase [Enemella evansiae]OYO15502.1 NADP-dependent oxidoreductase [Enemella evansiae]